VPGIFGHGLFPVIKRVRPALADLTGGSLLRDEEVTDGHRRRENIRVSARCVENLGATVEGKGECVVSPLWTLSYGIIL